MFKNGFWFLSLNESIAEKALFCIKKGFGGSLFFSINLCVYELFFFCLFFQRFFEK